MKMKICVGWAMTYLGLRRNKGTSDMTEMKDIDAKKMTIKRTVKISFRDTCTQIKISKARAVD